MPSIDHLLTQTCDIQGRTLTTNRLGQESFDFSVDQNGAPILKATGVKCRVDSTEVFEKYTDRSLGIADERVVIFFKAGTDIGESDRITAVRDGNGTQIYTNVDVTGVRNIPGRRGILHHIEVTGIIYRPETSVTWST